MVQTKMMEKYLFKKITLKTSQFKLIIYFTLPIKL